MSEETEGRFYHLNWWKPAEHAEGRISACDPKEADRVEVEIRWGAGYSNRIDFDLDMEKDFSSRTYKMRNLTKMLDLMFGFGIREGKRQVREALGI